MRLISGTSDIFGKLPGGLPGVRQAYGNQNLFGLGQAAAAAQHRKKKVHAVEDGEQTPDLLPDYGPTGQGYRELPPEQVPTHKLPGAGGAVAFDEDYGSDLFGLGAGGGATLSPYKDYGSSFFGLGQDQTAPPAGATPPAPAQAPAGAPPAGGAPPEHHRNWLMIGLGVVVVAGIIGYLMYNSKKGGGGMGNVGKSSKAGRKFIRRQTKKLIRAGMPQKRAVAAAYSMARQKHYKVPAKA